VRAVLTGPTPTPSPALDAALADIDTVFNGFAGSHGSGCPLCHAPEKTTYLRAPYTHVPLDVLQRYLFEVHDHFDDRTSAMRRLVPQAARAVADDAPGGDRLRRPRADPVGLALLAGRAGRRHRRVKQAWWQDGPATP
jgi:hypothetical protein